MGVGRKKYVNINVRFGKSVVILTHEICFEKIRFRHSRAHSGPSRPTDDGPISHLMSRDKLPTLSAQEAERNLSQSIFFSLRIEKIFWKISFVDSSETYDKIMRWNLPYDA